RRPRIAKAQSEEDGQGPAQALADTVNLAGRAFAPVLSVGRMSTLFRTKSIAALIATSDHPSHRLKKTLGLGSLVALGIGIVVGSGIFTLTGTAAAGLK